MEFDEVIEPERTVVVLSDNLVMEARMIGDKLLSARGTKAKVEPIEMNYVKITQKGREYFLQLGTSVRWIDSYAFF